MAGNKRLEELIDIESNGFKTCRTCGETKPETEFEVSTRTVNKVHRLNQCRKCREFVRKQERKCKKIHGKTRPIGTPCDCCGRTDVKLRLDHCHKTGMFRGWLCHQCNIGIGGLGDSTEGMYNAIRYLLKSEKNSVLKYISDEEKKNYLDL